MARIAKEIMNSELFSLRPSDEIDSAVDYILALGITAAPVLSEARTPIGVISLRDLVSRKGPGKVAERMTVPAVTVRESDSIEEVARTIADRGVHRVIVVDAEGRAVGVVSSIDVTSALIGLPVRHPSAFPHWDKSRGVSWSDDTLLEGDRLDVAPDGPGVLALVSGGRDAPERVVWGEATRNVRTRLFDLLSRPQDDMPELKRILATYRGLRFRAAAVRSVAEQERVAEAVMAEARKALAPITAE